MGLVVQRARVGRIEMEEPVIQRNLRGWAVMALQYNGEWWYIGRETRRPIEGQSTAWRDLVKDATEALVFEGEREAERFAFMVAYQNPQRTGNILVEKVDARS